MGQHKYVPTDKTELLDDDIRELLHKLILSFYVPNSTSRLYQNVPLGSTRLKLYQVERQTPPHSARHPAESAPSLFPPKCWSLSDRNTKYLF